MNALGKRIRLLRHQKELNLEDVARKLDISVPAFSKIETGITDINLSRLQQIASVFGLTVVQMLTFNGESEDRKRIDELETINKKLIERDEEVICLRQKMIELLEELRRAEYSI